MRGKNLLECMQYIDDTLIEEALNPTIISYKDKPAIRWVMAVASVIVIGISVTTFWSHQNANRDFNMDKQESTNNDINAQMDMTDNTVGSDAGKSVAETGLITEIAKDASTSVADNSISTEVKKESAKDQATQEPMKEKSVAEQATAKSNIESLETQEETKLTDLEVQKEIKTAYKVIYDYYGEKDTSEYCYAVPEKGTVLRYQYLQKTIDYYAAQENITDDSAVRKNTTDVTDNTIYAYQVVIDIYGDIETKTGTQYEDLYHSDGGNLLIEQEYRRLIDLGYAVTLSEDFQLTGTFTKAEMDTFLSSPEYGYVFRFENES
ncbi:MAG: hypothetical protein K1W16_07205 [Lachnospiraceae bacterium]|jgi:hypothetical protein